MSRYYVEAKYGTDLPSRMVRSYLIKDSGRADVRGYDPQVAVLSVMHPNKYGGGEASLYYHRHHFGQSVRNRIINWGLYRCQVTVYQDSTVRPQLTNMGGYRATDIVGLPATVVNLRSRRIRRSIPRVAWEDVLSIAFNAHKDHFIQPFLDRIAELPGPWNLMLENPHAFFTGLLGRFTPMLPEDL